GLALMNLVPPLAVRHGAGVSKGMIPDFVPPGDDPAEKGGVLRRPLADDEEDRGTIRFGEEVEDPRRGLRVGAVGEREERAAGARGEAVPLRPPGPGDEVQAAARHAPPGRGVRSHPPGAATAPAAVTPARRSTSPGTRSRFPNLFGVSL